MNEWKTVRLGDVFNLQMGKTPDRKNLDFFSTTDNKWISIADISKADKYIIETKEYISDEAVKKSGIKQIPANTVIMSFKLSIGKTAITKEPMYSNEAIMAFLPNGKYEVDNDFLYHLFSNKDWSEGSNKAVKGITLNKASLLEAKILLPPLAIQKQIAKIMDKCTEVISKNERMLENYDSLIKSRFIEMFGDPHNNTKYPYKNVGEFTTVTSGGTPDRKNNEYWKNGKIPWIKTTELQNNELTEVEEFITQKGLDESSAKMMPKETLLIAMYGQGKTRGMTAYLGIEASTNQACACILPSKEINQRYLWYYFILSYDKLRDLAKGGNQPNLNGNMIKSFPVLMPPIDMQNKYVSFVQQIDKSKFEMAIYEKLWYNYQIWRKKMGLFRGILDLFSTWTISDKFGLGAGFLYADYAWEKANERELNKMKAGVTQTITNYINENRKLLNDDLIQILNTFINSIANCNKFNANSILSELKNFLMHKCAYHSCIIEILNHSIEAIESIPEDNLDDGVKIKALQKTKNVIDCSDSNQLPILLKDLFSFYDENGIEVENEEELFDKFESLRKEYLA